MNIYIYCWVAKFIAFMSWGVESTSGLGVGSVEYFLYSMKHPATTLIPRAMYLPLSMIGGVLNNNKGFLKIFCSF